MSMNERLLNKEHISGLTGIIKRLHSKSPLFDLFSQTMTLVDDALASNKTKSIIKKDFATLIQQVEKGIYG